MNRDVTDVEELGDIIQKVIHYHTLRGKFSSIHPELRREGIIRVEVGKEGLHFIRDSGAFEIFNFDIIKLRYAKTKLLTSGEVEEEELLRQAIALSLQD